MPASEAELDLYSELTNIGAGNAATALSDLLSIPVDVHVPQAMELTLAEAVQLVATDDEEVVIVLVTVTGQLEGLLCMVFSKPEHFLEALGATEEFQDSAMAEIGNIFGSRFLIAIEQMTGMSGMVEPPALGMTDRITAFETVLAMSAQQEPFFMLRAQLELHGKDALTEVVYLPGPDTIDQLKALLG